MSWWYYRSNQRSARRNHPKPVRTNEGIKARTKKGRFAANWWANRWLQTLEALIDRRRLGRGRMYARKGQVLSIEEAEDGFVARVQGTRYKPYEVHMSMEHLEEHAWDAVVDNLSSQAIFAAQLLSGEMPRDIESVFEEAGYSLFPQKEEEIQTECSCPDKANPCKHIAAVFYLLAEQFDEDPFLLFKMRGRSKEEILEVMRQQDRIAKESDLADGFGIDVNHEPMSEDLSQFWKMKKLPENWNVSMESPAIRAPVIRRLGFPTFLSDELSHCLMAVYMAIEDQAIDLAFSEEDTSLK